MERQMLSPAKCRLIDRVLFVVAPLFFLDFVLGWWGFHYHHLHPAGALAVICAGLQSLPVLAFIVILGFYLSKETDDFQRALYIQSLLWGTGATLAVTTFMGSMEKYSQVARMDVAEVQFVFVIGMCASLAVNAWRYR